MSDVLTDAAAALDLLEKAANRLRRRLDAEPAWQTLKQAEAAGTVGTGLSETYAALDAAVPDWRCLAPLEASVTLLRSVRHQVSVQVPVRAGAGLPAVVAVGARSPVGDSAAAIAAEASVAPLPERAMAASPRRVSLLEALSAVQVEDAPVLRPESKTGPTEPAPARPELPPAEAQGLPTLLSQVALERPGSDIADEPTTPPPLPEVRPPAEGGRVERGSSADGAPRGLSGGNVPPAASRSPEASPQPVIPEARPAPVLLPAHAARRVTPDLAIAETAPAEAEVEIVRVAPEAGRGEPVEPPRLRGMAPMTPSATGEGAEDYLTSIDEASVEIVRPQAGDEPKGAETAAAAAVVVERAYRRPRR
jgi:hypothetical protein